MIRYPGDIVKAHSPCWNASEPYGEHTSGVSAGIGLLKGARAARISSAAFAAAVLMSEIGSVPMLIR